ncbi:MAG: nucleotidyltransferase domain-containing protein [Romboutsia sp.]
MRNIHDEIKESIVDIFPRENTLAIIIFGSYGTEKQNNLSDIDIAWIPKTKVPITELAIKTQDLKNVLEDIDIDLKIVSENYTIDLRKSIFEGDIIYESREFKDYLNHFYFEHSDVIDILDWRDMHGD